MYVSILRPRPKHTHHCQANWMLSQHCVESSSSAHTMCHNPPLLSRATVKTVAPLTIPLPLTLSLMLSRPLLKGSHRLCVSLTRSALLRWTERQRKKSTRLLNLLPIKSTELEIWKPESSLAFKSSLRVKLSVTAILSRPNPISMYPQHINCPSQRWPVSVQGTYLLVHRN